MTVFNVFSLLGGLALFLFGMDIMGKALEKQAGGQLQKILSKLTDNPLKAFSWSVRHRRDPELQRHHRYGGWLCQQRHHGAASGHRRYHGQ